MPDLVSDVDDAAGGAAELGVVAARLDLDLFDESSSIVLPETPVCRFVVSMPSMMKRFSEPDAPSI